MTEETPKIQAAYSVIMKSDGTLETVPLTENVTRTASTYDIYQTSKQLVSEIDDFLLAERVAKAVVEALQPVPPSEQQRAKIAEALSERGIDPTKA
jgi:hypothetical protein